MVKEEATKEVVMVFTSGSWSTEHRLALLPLRAARYQHRARGNLVCPETECQPGSSACHPGVSVRYINGQMAEERLCLETMFPLC